jgi:hypothetical protein
VCRAFPSCVRSILTEIYLCHAFSCHEMLSGNAAAGGGLAADAVLDLLASPPTIPARDPPVADNVDEQAAAIPPLAHALSQLATHAVSLKAVAQLVATQERAKSEIKEYSERVHFVREDDLYDFFVIQRRRIVTECNFALGHIGQLACAQNRVEVCSACVSALLAQACDPEGEPGGQWPSYMTCVRVVHSAITNLIRLASSPSSCAATPLVPSPEHKYGYRNHELAEIYVFEN